MRVRQNGWRNANRWTVSISALVAGIAVSELYRNDCLDGILFFCVTDSTDNDVYDPVTAMILSFSTAMVTAITIGEVLHHYTNDSQRGRMLEGVHRVENVILGGSSAIFSNWIEYALHDYISEDNLGMAR